MHGHFFPHLFFIDIIFGLIIGIICFIIYFRTRELYELTSHKGIKYFRYAFLFFGFSFLAKMIFPFSRIFFERSFFIPPLNGFIMSFLGITAVLCLLYSLFWKQFREKSFNHLFILILIALIIAGATLFGRLRFYLFLIQALLFSIILIVSLVKYKGRKGKNIQLHILYILLACSWIASSLALFASHISLLIGLVLHIVSVVLFCVILSKVIKKTGENGKKKR